MHVTFCEYFVFHEFGHSLYITLAKYLEQEGIADLLFSICLYTVFLSSELFSWDESSMLLDDRHVFHCTLFSYFSMLLDDISDMFFIAPCLANLSDISFQWRPQWDGGTQQNSIPIPLYMIQCIKYFTSSNISPLILQFQFFNHRELIWSRHIKKLYVANWILHM